MSEASESELEDKEDPTLRYQEILEGYCKELQEKIEERESPCAIIAIIDKELEEPIILSRGHIYDVASLSAFVTRNFKSQIDEQLST